MLLDALAIEHHPKLGTLDIELPTGCRHLVLTGPNGSGKSTVLRGLVQEIRADFVRGRAEDRLRRATNDFDSLKALRGVSDSQFNEAQREFIGAEDYLAGLRDAASDLGTALVHLRRGSNHVVGADGMTLAYLGARRSFEAERTGKPPRSFDGSSAAIDAQLVGDFYEWLKHQYLQALLAKADNDQGDASRITAWLQWFEHQLRAALGLERLALRFDRPTYELAFVEQDLEYWVEDLADGHSAVLAILAEILMRLDPYAWKSDPTAAKGVVIIDEPELHLHPELEESILPFLTGAFPSMQFVLATHSPVVISSVPDAFVFDLGRREGAPSSDFVGRRYGDVMVAHFGVPTDLDLATTRRLDRLRELVEQRRGPGEEREYQELMKHLKGVDHPLVFQEMIREYRAGK